MNINEKRKHQLDNSGNQSDLTNSERGNYTTKKLKKSSQYVLEVKLCKYEKWVGRSTSLHESETLMSNSQLKMLDMLQNSDQKVNFIDILRTSMNDSDIYCVSQFTDQCTLVNHQVDKEKNSIKFTFNTKANFDCTKEYTLPSHVDIMTPVASTSTNHTDNYYEFDQELGSSQISSSNYEVGSIIEDIDDDGI